jgi:hypothetical protein
MTEQEWLASEDPPALLSWAQGEGLCGHLLYRLSGRKLRLLACACARFDEDPGRFAGDAIRRAEWIADGLESPADPTGPHHEGWRVADRWLAQPDARAAAAAWAVCVRPGVGAALLRDIVGNPFRPVMLPYERRCRRCKRRPPDQWWTICPFCLPDLSGFGGSYPWLTPAVLLLAGRAYEDRQEDGILDPLTLLALADALEEAGCDSAGLLAHLRSAGPHVRGCWAVDIILG